MSNGLQHYSANSLQPFATPGLQRFAIIINQERGVLEEYAAQPKPNIVHLNRRNAFLHALTESYNLFYQELQPISELRLLDKWLVVEHELITLMADKSLSGVHIRLQFDSGNYYGFINL